MAPTCDFFLQDMLNAFKGQKQGCVFILCEHAHIRNELENLVVQFECGVFNIFAVKNVFAAKLVPHIGHEFKDAVIAFKNAFEFLEQQGKGYALLVAPACQQVGYARHNSHDCPPAGGVAAPPYPFVRLEHVCV